MSHPAGKYRPNYSLRRMMFGVAMFAVGAALAMKGFSLWDFHRRAPASEKLLRPIIAEQDRLIKSNKIDEKESFRLVASRMRNTAKLSAARVIRIAWLISTKPMSLVSANKRLSCLMSDLRYLRDVVRIVQSREPSSPSVLDNFRGGVMNARQVAYHTHLRDYYSRLLSEHRTVIPPLPPELAAEKRAVEADLQRVNNDPTFDLGEEPPWYLVPGTPKPKKRRPKPVWFGDSM